MEEMGADPLLVYVRNCSSIVSCYLVINTVISFIALAVMSKYGDKSFQIKLMVVMTIVYMLATYFDLLASANIDKSLQGVMRGVIAVFFMFLLFSSLYYGLVSAAIVHDFILESAKSR